MFPHDGRPWQVECASLITILCSGLVASIVRFAIFFNSDALEDPTWKSAYLNIWTIVEPGTYFMAACLPALRPILLVCARQLGLKNLAVKFRSRSTPQSHHSQFLRMTSLSLRNKEYGDEISSRRNKQGSKHRSTTSFAECTAVDSYDVSLVENESVRPNEAEGERNRVSGIQVVKDVSVTYEKRQSRVIREGTAW